MEQWEPVFQVCIAFLNHRLSD
ncbi:unnamed protein product [Timema podura]|uniref:Uncharacterized protein n=1 Tax=Timema podura TaxID=61482 RepID=A0ABN7PHD1_TIMPD|nr:unnamed protein product [Timema podura]